MAEPHIVQIESHERRVEQLRITFDLYFQGLEREPPLDERDTLIREINRLRLDAARWNTAERFRINQLQQKLLTYDRMWARTLKAIEEGTHKRDKYKISLAKKREEERLQREQAQRAQQEQQLREQKQREQQLYEQHMREQQLLEQQMRNASSVSGTPQPTAAQLSQAQQLAQQRYQQQLQQMQQMQQSLQNQANAASGSATSPPAHRPSASQGDGLAMNDTRLKQLYQVYMQARKQTGETGNISYDSLVNQLRSQVPGIRSKHNCESVEFKVVVKDGKALLKAVPK